MDNSPGVLLAVDWGQARIGVAACDRDGVLSYPVATICAVGDPLAELVQLVEEYQPRLLLVGLPHTLAGKVGIAAQKILVQAAQLQKVSGIPVHLVDERLTTVVAARQLHEAGWSAKKQKRRKAIDQQAAVGILDHALNAWRETGVLPGRELDSWSSL